MPSLPLSPTITLTTLLALPPALYLFNIHRSTAPSYPYHIHVNKNSPASLTSSRTVTAIINPTAHPTGGDSHSVIIPVSRLPPGRDGSAITNRELLSRFVGGVFGGQVFAPERWALRAWRWAGGGCLLGIRCIEEDAARARKEAWTAGEVRGVGEWEVGMRVSGAFQVADVQVVEGRSNEKAEVAESERLGLGEDQQSESYADFVYGSDEGRLKGVHRFSVLRRRGQHPEGEQEMCELRLAGVSCNPKEKQALPGWLVGFHLLYAKLLFRAGIAEVLASVA